MKTLLIFFRSHKSHFPNFSLSSFKSPHTTNRSLYDELKASSFLTTFTSPFIETSSEFMKFENMKMDEDSKSDESSMEKKFKDDEFGFRNNETTEERHSMNEAVFDEEVVKYSSKNITKPEENIKTTALPAAATTSKKGKYLDLIPRGDDNINASIPNAAEVWALAGMREIETRKPMESDETTEMFADSLNNTAKNLLDWTEITKMNNESMTQSSEENLKDLSATTVHNDINIDDDPATSENKETIVFVTSRASTTLPTLKPIIEDNRLEIETGNVEMLENGKNKSQIATARIDSDVFGKSQEEREESAIELIEPSKKIDTKTKENLKLDEMEAVAATTESSESFTTESVEIVQTTTMENIETTSSIVDSFTVIGEDEDSDDVFKRTITELPPVTTTDALAQVTTTSNSAPQTTTIVNEKIQMETTTEINPTINEIPESTQRYNKSTSPTKSISTRVVTTEKTDSTESDNESLSSTLIPKFFTTSQPIATTQNYEESSSSSSPTVEIFDDDKFKYNTLLPETTTTLPFESNKSEDFEESTTKVVKSDSPNRENLDGEPGENGSSLGLISALVSVVAVLVLAGVVYVSFESSISRKIFKIGF